MTPDNIRNAAFSLDLAVRQLREYASLIEHGVERAVNIQLATDNIRSAVAELDGYVTLRHEPHQMHASVKMARMRELFEEQAAKNAPDCEPMPDMTRLLQSLGFGDSTIDRAISQDIAMGR